MAKEHMQMGEGFQATVTTAGQTPAPATTKHRVIGWGTIFAILSAIAYYWAR